MVADTAGNRCGIILSLFIYNALLFSVLEFMCQSVCGGKHNSADYCAKIYNFCLTLLLCLYTDLIVRA